MNDTYSSQIILNLKNVSYGYSKKRNILFDLNLKIAQGQIVALVGPSGSGKSTLLKLLLGTHHPRQGEVIFSNSLSTPARQYVIRHPGTDRGIVYQKYSLLPHMTVLENVTYGLRLKLIPFWKRWMCTPRQQAVRNDITDRASEMLYRLGVGEFKDLYPHELSGGMCQRVSLAQALITKPSVLLLDEPFGALDATSREDLQRMIIQIYLENKDALLTGNTAPVTIILVTHDLNEAIFVADRVICLSSYWNWKEQGYHECPGSRLVYDASLPVFHYNENVNLEDYRQIKTEIISAGFDSNNQNNKENNLKFWS